MSLSHAGTQPRLNPSQTPLVILSEGCFGEHASKTATGVIRYGDWPIAAVIDSQQAGKTVSEVTGIPNDAPIVDSLQEAMRYHPKALLIGTAPQGGGLPPEWRAILKEAIGQNLHLISGLHQFLRDDPTLVQAAQEQGVMLWDVRDPDQAHDGPQNVVALRKKRPAGTKVITLVGSDCCVGKMFSALELYQGAKQLGKRSRFIATGQTGILISGTGVPLDRVIGDFMAGHIERCIFDEIEQASPQEQPEWIFVEGQGSLLHPGYSGVTMSLLHGSNPDALILCHNPELETIWGYDVPMPPLKELVKIYETAANWIKLPGKEAPAKVVGIALNTSAYNEKEARHFVAQAQATTGLPATDPVRYGVTPILNYLNEFLSSSFPQEALS